MSYLLDTCILSKLRKIAKYPDPPLKDWMAKHSPQSLFLSVITLGEIQKGISLLDLNKSEEKNKRLILENWFNEELIPQFTNRILLVDEEISMAWGRITSQCRSQGISLPMADGLIAATALIHNLTVVTENISDFIATGAKLYNPWIS